MTSYLAKRTLYPPLIATAPAEDLFLVVVIPAYDEPNLLDSLAALLVCNTPTAAVEVIVVINDAEDSAAAVRQANAQHHQRALSWAEGNSSDRLQFQILNCQGLPRKHAGVGLARKIGMDEACRRLERVGRPEGVILGFDADSSCDPNYFQAVEQYFAQHPQAQAASIYFEHPLSGTAYSAEVYRAVTWYELHLRYFIQAQRWAGLPYAYQTVGSSMAVRCRAYQAQGGMNRRQAGEDFYFLHKFIPLGHYGEITTTRVVPSPRPSRRVPFGTGRAVEGLLRNGLQGTTYAPQSFQALRTLTAQVPSWYETEDFSKLPSPLSDFLHSISGRERLKQIRAHTADRSAFIKRFYRWFDAFLLMKYLHFAREYYYEDISTVTAADWLLQQLGEEPAKGVGPVGQLIALRRRAREGKY